MRSRIVADSTASPGRTKAHSRLRAKSTTGPLLPAVANACGCSILAEANTSACAPPAISSFSVPEGPYLACTFCPDAASNASVTSVRAVRRLPAAWSKTGSDASAGTAIVVTARMTATRQASCPRCIGIGEKQLLPVDLVIRDRLLPFGRNEPVDEGLAEVLLHIGMLFGIDQHDAVLVEQALVAGHQDLEIAAVLEREPGAAVGEHIGVGGGRGVERRAHALADLLVPGTFLLADVDAGGLPEVEFGDMGTRAVAAGDEGRALGLDRLQSLGDVGHALDAAGSLFGPIKTKSLYMT